MGQRLMNNPKKTRYAHHGPIAEGGDIHASNPNTKCFVLGVCEDYSMRNVLGQIGSEHEERI